MKETICISVESLQDALGSSAEPIASRIVGYTKMIAEQGSLDIRLVREVLYGSLEPIAASLVRQAMIVEARNPREAESLYRLATLLRAEWSRGMATLA